MKENYQKLYQFVAYLADMDVDCPDHVQDIIEDAHQLLKEIT